MRTTGELISTLPQSLTRAGLGARFATLLTEADLVKFARARPGAAAVEEVAHRGLMLLEIGMKVPGRSNESAAPFTVVSRPPARLAVGHWLNQSRSLFPEVAMIASRRIGFSLPLVAALAFVPTSPASAQGVEQPRVPLRTAIAELTTPSARRTRICTTRRTRRRSPAIYLPDAVWFGERRHAAGSGGDRQGAGGGCGRLAADHPVSDTTRVFGNTAWDVGTMTVEVRTASRASTAISSYSGAACRTGRSAA